MANLFVPWMEGSRPGLRGSDVRTDMGARPRSRGVTPDCTVLLGSLSCPWNWLCPFVQLSCGNTGADSASHRQRPGSPRSHLPGQVQTQPVRSLRFYPLPRAADAKGLGLQVGSGV